MSPPFRAFLLLLIVATISGFMIWTAAIITAQVRALGTAEAQEINDILHQ